jgi:Amt family ammonium transporter
MNSGDTAWVLVSTALVLFMLPGLAFFYGGLVSRRNVLVMLQQNFFPLGLISILWILVGYSLAFGSDAGGGVIGNLDLFALHNLGRASLPILHVVGLDASIPTLAFVAYMMMFAIITPALVTGATANRLTFSGYAWVIALWSLIVYAPVAHWLWSPLGWLHTLGAQDWAGGLVVHGSAGAAALALLLVIGPRRRWPESTMPPHSIPFTVLGAGILWFGWIGFNGADGLQANTVAAQAVMNTQIAAAAAMLVWLFVERWTSGHATVLGGVTGAVAGLATITPCAGYVDTYSAIVIGGLAGLICSAALRLKFVFRLDDALDVLAVHFVGGILGTFLLGLFADAGVNPSGLDGLLYGGGGRLLGDQVVAIVVVVTFSFCATWLIATGVARTIGLRASPSDEDCLDTTQQAISAYALDLATGGMERAAQVGTAPAMAQPGQARLRLIRVLVKHPDVDELRRALLEAGAVSIVLSEASSYTSDPRTEVVRGQPRMVEFDPRLRLEVIAEEPNVTRVVEAIRRMRGVSSYLQVLDADFIEPAVADGAT